MSDNNTGYQGTLLKAVSGDQELFDFNIDSFIKENYNVSTKEMIDLLLASNGKGTQANGLTNSLFGFNVDNSPAPYPVNNDNVGYIFVTKPDMNLTVDNVVNARELQWLLNTNQNSLGRFIRNTLDPKQSKDTINSPSSLVDPRNGFIPAFSNHAITVTGFPDNVTGVRSTRPGVYKEVHIMVDDVFKNFGEYSLNMSLKNVRGSIMLNMIYAWMFYQSAAYLGDLSPRPENVIENRLDYTTRIYRITLDSTKTYVQNIWCSGYSIPVSINTGQLLTYDIEKPFNALTGTIDIEFRCVGSKLNDELIIEQFNNVTIMHNPLMKGQERSNSMKKLTKRELNFLQNSSYPYINRATRELEWWVTNEVYNLNKGKIELLDTLIASTKDDYYAADALIDDFN